MLENPKFYVHHIDEEGKQFNPKIIISTLTQINLKSLPTLYTEIKNILICMPYHISIVDTF